MPRDSNTYRVKSNPRRQKATKASVVKCIACKHTLRQISKSNTTHAVSLPLPAPHPFHRSPRGDTSRDFLGRKRATAQQPHTRIKFGCAPQHGARRDALAGPGVDGIQAPEILRRGDRAITAEECCLSDLWGTKAPLVGWMIVPLTVGLSYGGNKIHVRYRNNVVLALSLPLIFVADNTYSSMFRLFKHCNTGPTTLSTSMSLWLAHSPPA
ncbi:hypothetical protein C7974DRAFT_131298 [Boeremia exigua]|uniref:uncharacterized protein n=1 Tax=Boeremia exigua TaxID=749465 RepID=UPI001E8CF727|nr:uncharacterized protein C7974DRAFT_131298 [Boeremia exigua]KAH6639437.1 hypothetical protein C7974DRAFT_131298 [Boeremia exigua]